MGDARRFITHHPPLALDNAPVVVFISVVVRFWVVRAKRGTEVADGQICYC